MKKGVDYTGVCVVYFCHDGHGNFLFNKRGVNCKDEQGTWDHGGGGIEFDDTIESTLKKEIREEFCTDVINYDFLGYLDVHRENNGIKTHWVALDFKVLVDKEKVQNGEPNKFDEIGWFRLDNLPIPLHSQTLKRLEIYKNKLQ